jgi:PAS domain S-box-containing protein
MTSGAVPASSRAPYDLVRMLVETTTDHAVATLDASGTVLSWNPGAERLYGWSAASAVGSSIDRLYPPPDGPAAALAAAAADGHHETEGWRVRGDGTLFWASVVITALRLDGGPDLLGFGMVSRDLTDRKRNEDALRESEERFRLLVTSVADYAIYLLDPEGRVSSWNVGAEALKGYRADEIIGLPLSTFYTEEDRLAGVPEGALAEARAKGRWAAEGWRLRKDGSRFWASVVITSLVSADGQHRGFAKVTRDLTERKQNDEIRSEVLSIIAHDLRAPAGVIQHLLYGLHQDWSTATEADKLAAIDRIGSRTSRMASLADDLFDVSQIDAGRLEVDTKVVDVGPIVDQVAADAPSRRVHVVMATDAKALGDERRIWQVVTNLVSNAIKFSPSDSPVEVRVDRFGDEVVIAVVDHGPGIGADELPKLFERFSRLARTSAVPGTGIGLFIARSLAEAQGGRIEVTSVEGEGSTFKLILPAASAVAAVGA